MKARICWRIGDFEDSKEIECDTFAELRAEADRIVTAVNPDDYWSENVSESSADESGLSRK